MDTKNPIEQTADTRGDGIDLPVYSEGKTTVTLSPGVRLYDGQWAAYGGAEISHTKNLTAGGDLKLGVSAGAKGWAGLRSEAVGYGGIKVTQDLQGGHSVGAQFRTAASTNGDIAALSGIQYDYERPDGASGVLRQAGVSVAGGLSNGQKLAYAGGEARVDVFPEYGLYGIFEAAAVGAVGQAPQYALGGGAGYDLGPVVAGTLGVKEASVEAVANYDSSAGNKTGMDEEGLGLRRNGIGGRLALNLKM